MITHEFFSCQWVKLWYNNQDYFNIGEEYLVSNLLAYVPYWYESYLTYIIIVLPVVIISLIVSAVMKSDNPEKTARELKELIQML